MNENTITDGLGSVRTEAAPRRTITAYKLMRLVDGQLYPLFIDRSEPVQMGVWYNADAPALDVLQKLDFGYHLIDLQTQRVVKHADSIRKEDVKRATANNQRWIHVIQQATKIGYKQVGISISNGSEVKNESYAYRPGWHCGQLPVMNQVAKGPNKDILDDSFVFTEIEISADVDYNAEARANGGELYYIPTNGYYLRCTNANKKAAQADELDWYIAGAIRINRIISDSEARDIIDRYNREHGTHVAYSVPRESGKQFNADTMQLEGCLNGTNDFYALFSDDNDLLVDFGVGWNRRDVRRKAVEYMKEHNIQSAFIEITDCEGEIKDTIDIDLGLQGTKKADSDAGDFCLEIKISKNSLTLSSDKISAAGSLRGFLRAAKIAACPSGKQPLAGSATPTPRVTANIKDIQDSIAIYEEKIKNWEKSPITNELAFLLYVLTKLPHEASKNQSYYVIEENGSFRIRFSGHNAIARYLNKNERYKIGITFQSKDTPITFEPFYNVYYKEHVYYTEYLASEVLRDILQGIVDVLKGGFYNVPCDLPLYSPDEKKYKEHFGLQGLGEPASDAECRAVLGALLKDWIPDIKNVDKYLIDNCKIRLIRGFGDSFDRYLEERGLKNVFSKGSGENGTMIYSITDRNDQQNINYIKECIGIAKKEPQPKHWTDDLITDEAKKLTIEQRKEIERQIQHELLRGANSVEEAIARVKEKHPELWQTAEPTPGELTEAEKEKLRSYQGKGGSKDTTERGILDEYYTPDYVCEFMYRLAVKYGYTAGKVLEPSCATGNCIRPIYERNDYTHIDAFEINQTSRDICKKLYPDVNLYENYFETAFLEPPRYTIKAKKTWLPGAPYDLVIGNPPYGKHVNRYSAYFSGKDRFAQVEMFFMCKCLELLRSGGLLVFITSTNFMSTGSAYQQAKDRIGEMAELVDAYRLPKVFANTDICTDIIVLRKK